MKHLGVVASAAVLMLGSQGTAVPATPQPRCASPEARAFDFWIGRWNVTEKGQAAGVNVIESILGGCALLESWTGAKGGTGRSLNFYDAGDGAWHQTWIDNSGGALYLSGGFEDGAMRMTGERPASGENPPAKHRITWTPLPDGTVRQLWEAAPAAGGDWKVIFDGLYTRAD